MKKLQLKLYIAGRSPRSDKAVFNLNRVLAELAHTQFDLSIIDVLNDAQQAEEALILATPTLVRLAPDPARRIVGDLSDRQSLLDGLDIGNTETRGDRETS